MPPLTVRLSRWRFLLLGLLLLPFALLGLLLANDEPGSTITGLGFVVFFGGLAVFALVKVVQNKPVILLNDACIEDTRLKIGVIPWGEVVRAFELPYLWQKNVQVQVRDATMFKRRQTGLVRSIGEMNAAFGWTPFVLVTANTDTPAKAVVDYIYQQLLRQQLGSSPAAGAVPAGEVGEY